MGFIKDHHIQPQIINGKLGAALSCTNDAIHLLFEAFKILVCSGFTIRLLVQDIHQLRKEAHLIGGVYTDSLKTFVGKKANRLLG